MATAITVSTAAISPQLNRRKIKAFMPASAYFQ
jgi:hypothetical protein